MIITDTEIIIIIITNNPSVSCCEFEKTELAYFLTISFEKLLIVSEKVKPTPHPPKKNTEDVRYLECTTHGVRIVNYLQWTKNRKLRNDRTCDTFKNRKRGKKEEETA